jgi:gentisate 1,2-dioxygenase
MEITKMTTRLSAEERETVLVYDNVDKKWVMDTTVPKHANKAKKQGWKQIAEFVYEDGTVCGGAFEAPARAITIRNAEKKQMTESQTGNLFGDDESEDDE